MKKKIVIKKIILIPLLAFVLWFIVSLTVENVSVGNKINNFKDKGIFQEDISTDTLKYYKVSRETSQPNISAFTYDSDGTEYFGSSGDILVGLESNIENIPFVSEILTYAVGGHAALCCYPYSDGSINIKETDCIEASLLEMGKKRADTKTKYISRSYWMDNKYRDQVIGLRVKGTEEQKLKAFSRAVSYLGDSYNKSFIFNTKNKHYCTDLISKSFSYANINLNYDYFATTVLDLIISRNTYIFLVKEVKNSITYIYYLG